MTLGKTYDHLILNDYKSSLWIEYVNFLQSDPGK